MASSSKRVIYNKAFDNVVVIDPNKIINENGFPEDRNVEQENLVMYANLECNIQPRSRLLSGEDSQTLETVGIAKINFLKPNDQDYLTTNWTELQSNYSNPNTINSELLGITNITYRASQDFTPQVNITLEDIKGRALFESGDESIYSAFFNLPYPTFYLTLKGYYGKAIRMPLILQKFLASLDQNSGNFLINLSFIGYKFNSLNDITLGYLMSVPFMYQRQLNQSVQVDPNGPEQASVDLLNGNDVRIESSFGTEGRDTINQVYSKYKELGLVEQSFPNLTINELVSRLQNFEKNYQELLGQVSTKPITDAKEFDNLLTNYAQIIFFSKNPLSWKEEFLDTKKYYVILDKGNRYKVYTYTKNIFDNLKFDDAINKLKTLINDNNKTLEEAPTFGTKNNGDRQIPVNIKFSSIAATPYYLPNPGTIDILETAKERFVTKSPTNSQLNIIATELKNLDETRRQIEELRSQSDPPKNPVEIPFLFRFDGDGFFLDEINKIKKSLSVQSEDIERNLTAQINEIIKSDKGIGFEPNIRNILAVIYASTDAFLRMLDKVHKKAFDARNNSKKKQAVITDIKQEPDSPVYPWPEYDKQILVEGEPKYDLRYPGDPDYINETGADDYESWPEVEFVEEFQKAYLERLPKNVNSSSAVSDANSIRRLLISAFDTPSNISYSFLQQTPFLYEMWERVQAICHYQGFSRLSKYGDILNFLEAFEASNIKTAIGTNSPELIDFLKEYKFTPDNFLEFLSQNTPKSYELLSRGIYTTSYLKNDLNNNSKFLSQELPEVVTSIVTETKPSEVEDTINKYLKSTDKNSLYFTDILPFASEEWNKDQLFQGNNNHTIDKVFRTEKSLFYNKKTKKLVNYTSDFALDGRGDNDKNRPFNYFVSTSSEIPYEEKVKTNMAGFFSERVSEPKKSSYTEGRVTFYTSEIDTKSITTSMMNTPSFIRAIQNGVQNDKNNSPSPYVQAGYLFLNSLPLTNLKWPYRNSDDTTNSYIASTFKKYGAVHNMPKMWAAKIGSIWHRYKVWIENNVDILTDIVGDFDQNLNYDPQNSDPARRYRFTSQTENFTIKLSTTEIDTNLNNNDIINVGFYPRLLNDFFYFLNGRNLYTDDTAIQESIQAEIDNGNLILISNINSQLKLEAGYDPNNPNNFLWYSTFSVLFKNINPITNGNNLNYYYSAPSFGSQYSQVKSECIPQGILTTPIVGNQYVFNGSVRFLWGGTHFGYMPTINRFSPPDQYISWTRNNEWAWNLFLNSSNESGQLDYVEDLFGVFTYEELSLFENEFLNFCQSEQRTTSKFNIQSIIKNSTQVSFDDFNDAESNLLLEKFQKTQQVNFNSSINTYINENILYQKGNPTNFDYRTFSYFSTNPLKGVDDGVLNYVDNTPNSVPYSGNTQSFLQSQLDYPEAWITLQTYVGFSSLSGVGYYGDSSVITDFFPDMNIAFNSENIIRFANVIKIYATQKYLGNVTNKERFAVLMTQFIDEMNSFRDLVFDGMYTKLQYSLQTVKNTTTNEDNSKTTGETTKFEYYYLFKALNDKWVAANNYNKETMFEDILLLDRGSKNLGGKVIVDIFSIISLLKDNPKMTIHNLTDKIVRDHHFVPYNLPSYLNFYGAPNAGDSRNDENEESFADSMFGTFTEADYSQSKTKLVCYYAETGSEQLNVVNVKNGFNDDSWNFEQPTNNPVVENLSLKESKNDWSLSNKPVGIVADFGVQNQGIFQTIQVSQDLGKATSESLKADYELGNVMRGTNTLTQNVSLLKIYKTRAYKSTITMMGNMMIQPMMYVIIKHMPLFAGPYLVTEVEHVITNGSFTTKVVGTRQKTYTPPVENKLLETIKSQFVTKLINNLTTKRENQKRLETNTIQARSNVVNAISPNYLPTANPICTVGVSYASYSAVTTPVSSQTPVRNMFDSILTKVRELNFGSNSGDSMTYIVHTLFYIKSYKGTSFEYYGNNVPLIPISPGTPKWGGDLSKFFNKEYMCISGPSNETESYATFPTLDNCIEFTHSKYKNVFKDSANNVSAENIFVSGFTRTWIEKFPYDKTSTTTNLYDTFKTANPSEYNELERKVRESYNLVKARLTG